MANTLHNDGLTVDCAGCGERITVDIIDADNVLIGAECECGYYHTEYTPEFRQSADWLESDDESDQIDSVFDDMYDAAIDAMYDARYGGTNYGVESGNMNTYG